MKFQKNLNRVLEVFLVILMSILVVDVLWQVFSRYLLSSPSSFTDELAGFLLIWVGVLGAAYVAGRQEHLAIDILIQRSSPSRQRTLLFVIHALILLFAPHCNFPLAMSTLFSPSVERSLSIMRSSI